MLLDGLELPFNFLSWLLPPAHPSDFCYIWKSDIWTPAKWIKSHCNGGFVHVFFTLRTETDQISNCVSLCCVPQTLLEVHKKHRVQILVLKDSAPLSVGGAQRQIFTLIFSSGAWLWWNLNIASIGWVSNSLLTPMWSAYRPVSLLFLPQTEGINIKLIFTYLNRFFAFIIKSESSWGDS